MEGLSKKNFRVPHEQHLLAVWSKEAEGIRLQDISLKLMPLLHVAVMSIDESYPGVDRAWLGGGTSVSVISPDSDEGQGWRASPMKVEFGMKVQIWK